VEGDLHDVVGTTHQVPLQHQEAVAKRIEGSREQSLRHPLVHAELERLLARVRLQLARLPSVRLVARDTSVKCGHLSPS
jgi:hypothetical protein